MSRRKRSLTAADRRSLHEGPSSNAGAGWGHRRYRGRPIDDRLDDPAVRSLLAGEEFADRELLDDPEKI